MIQTESYQQVCNHARQTALLQSTLALLEWDQHTKLPQSASGYRADQIAALATQIHARRTDQALGELLARADVALDENEFDENNDEAFIARANVTKMEQEFTRNSKIPESLASALARAASEGQTAWIAARKNNDFASFAPHLTKIIGLKQEQAQAVGYQDHPYDALIDEYEPGISTAEVATVLSNLCEELVPLVAKIKACGKQVDTSCLRRTFPVEDQQRFAREVSSAIGFDYDRGRMDVTAHPFCTELGPSDCRITTRYDADFFNSAFFGTLHEAGHGIYEQGLDSSQYGLPAGSYCSLGIHESQSRLWENLVGRSRSFWQHYFPIAKKHFPKALSDVSENQFYDAVNCVSPSLIRVEADEATYNIHIAIRFELERDLIDGSLLVVDLPTAWNDLYQKHLGITPGCDADGVLQDVHWSAGLIGYFPTYALGNLYASQFFEAAKKDLGELDSKFAVGQFEELRTWLNQRIHRQGKQYSGFELGEKVAGQPLGHVDLLNHLGSKFGQVYEL
jgi:carboxypeptidase Taq